MNKKISAVLIILILSVLILPYFWVEVNTLIHKEEFKDSYLQACNEGCIIDADEGNYCKVFYKTKDKAKIFYATDTSTLMCRFSKNPKDNSWEICDAEVLWSAYGSASKFSFPFYPVRDFKSYINT